VELVKIDVDSIDFPPKKKKKRYKGYKRGYKRKYKRKK